MEQKVFVRFLDANYKVTPRKEAIYREETRYLNADRELTAEDATDAVEREETLIEITTSKVVQRIIYEKTEDSIEGGMQCARLNPSIP